MPGTATLAESRATCEGLKAQWGSELHVDQIFQYQAADILVPGCRYISTRLHTTIHVTDLECQPALQAIPHNVRVVGGRARLVEGWAVSVDVEFVCCKVFEESARERERILKRTRRGGEREGHVCCGWGPEGSADIELATRVVEDRGRPHI